MSAHVELQHVRLASKGRRDGVEMVWPRPPARGVMAVKRAMDVVVGLAGTLAFLLLYPALALLIRLDSPGPVLYRQPRVGRERRSRPRAVKGARADAGGPSFQIVKFRTMRSEAEAAGPQLCARRDPRVTRVGRLLRAGHLDELPQFLSVLRGEMSLIGPRPERPVFVMRYVYDVGNYRQRTVHMRPGLLGLSQLVVGYDDSIEAVQRKVRLDLMYQESLGRFWSWARMECWVLLRAVWYFAPTARGGHRLSAEPGAPATGSPERRDGRAA